MKEQAFASDGRREEGRGNREQGLTSVVKRVGGSLKEAAQGLENPADKKEGGYEEEDDDGGGDVGVPCGEPGEEDGQHIFP